MQTIFFTYLFTFAAHTYQAQKKKTNEMKKKSWLLVPFVLQALNKVWEAWTSCMCPLCCLIKFIKIFDLKFKTLSYIEL